MARLDFTKYEKEELLELLIESRGELKKQKKKLTTTREKLSSAKLKIIKMQTVIRSQQEGILDVIRNQERNQELNQTR